MVILAGTLTPIYRGPFKYLYGPLEGGIKVLASGPLLDP